MYRLPGDQIPSQQPPGRSLEKAVFPGWFMPKHRELHPFCTLLAGSTAYTACTVIFPDSSVLCDFPKLICKVSKSFNWKIDTGIGCLQLADDISPLNSLV